MDTTTTFSQKNLSSKIDCAIAKVRNQRKTSQLNKIKIDLTIVILLLICFGTRNFSYAQTNPTAQNIPYSQNFGTTNFSTPLAGMASWTGSGSRPYTTQALAEASLGGADQAITGATPSTTGGQYGHAPSSDGRLTIVQSSNATAGSTQAVLAINTTGFTSVNVSYDLVLTVPSSTRFMGLSLQYRVGTSGSFIGIAGSAVTYSGGTSNGGDADGASDFDNYSFALPSPALGQAVVQLRWVTWRDAAGSGGSDGLGIDNISVTGSSSPSINITAAHPASSNINQGSADNIIGGIALAVTNGNATLTGVSVNTSGGYSSSSDFTDFKFWLTNAGSYSLSGATQLGATQSSVTSGGLISVSGISSNNVISTNTTRYILVTASVSGSAVQGDIIRLASTAFSNITFSGSNNFVGTDPVAAGVSPTNDQTIVSLTPSIALSDASPAAGTINQNSNNNILKSVQVDVTIASTTLNSVTFTTSGNYSVADLKANSFKFYVNSSNSLSGATLLGTAQAIVATGNDVTVSGLSASLPIGTRFILLAVDASYNADPAHHISISSTPYSNIQFSLGTFSTTSPVPAGNDQTFVAVVPSIAIASPGPAAAINSFPASNMLLSVISIAPTINDAELTGLTITTSGNYLTSDFQANSVGLWLGPSQTDLTNAIFISGFSQSMVASGGTLSWSGLSQLVPIGTNYLIVTGNLSASAVAGHYIQITSTPFSNITFTQGTKTGTDPARAGGTLYFGNPGSVTDVIVPQYMVNGTTTGSRLQYVCRLTLNNLLPNATYRYYTGASLTSTIVTTATTAGNFFAINNSGGTYGHIVGQTSSKSLGTVNASVMNGDEFVALGRYAELTTNASGSYTGWFAVSPTGNAVFNSGSIDNFYVQLNAGTGSPGDTVVVQSLKSNNSITVLNPASGGLQAIRGTSNGTPENMVFLYDNTAGTGRPLYGTWIENDGITTNFTTWYSAPAANPVEPTNGSWGAYIPSALANGVQRIEERDVTTGAIAGCAATDNNGVWPTGNVNTVNPAGGTTPLVISSTDASFVCPILNTITTGTISPLSYCDDGNHSVSVTVPFDSSIYAYNAGNIFKAQISDASGSFSSPTEIGSALSTSNPASISASLLGFPAGTHYRIRVISTSPPIIGTPNTSDIVITNGSNYYVDLDGDGYGNPISALIFCSATDATNSGYVADNTDCDDDSEFSFDIHPGATEVCDELDNDCDGQTDEGVQNTYYRDFDTDTYGSSTVTTLACTPPSGYVSNNSDCNDANAAINPVATEICNGVDDDCDTQIDNTPGCLNTYFEDADGDSYGNPGSSISVLDPTPPSGYVTNNLDCNDNPVGGAAIHPGVLETCNNIDDNCDGSTDEGLTFVNYYNDNDLDTYGGTLYGSYCSAQAGKVTNNIDCDDNNNLVAPKPPVTISGALSFCTGGSTTLDAGNGAVYGGYTNYIWSNNAATQTINVTTAGTYTVTITGVGGCTNSTSVSVSINPLPTVTISGSSTICAGGTTLLDAGEGYNSYTWSTGVTTQTINANAATTYTVTVTNANNCSNSATKTLNSVPSPQISITPTDVSCNAGTNGSISTAPLNNSNCLNGPALVISKFLPNPTGIDSTQEFVELVATRNIDFSVTPYSVVFSNNGSATINGWKAGGTTTYAFDITSGSAVAGQAYYVGGVGMFPTSNRLRAINTIAVAGDGGIGSANTSKSGVIGNGGTADGIAVFASAIASVTPSTVPVDAILFGTSIGTAAIAGGTTGYQLPVNDLYPGGKILSSSFFTLDGKTDSVIVAAGTFNPGTGTFNSPRTFSYQHQSNAGGFVQGNPAISVSPLSGFTYSWNNSATTSNITGLTANTFTVTVTSCNGCSAQFSSTVGQPSAVGVTLVTNTNASCSNIADGFLEVSGNGGTPGYTYMWNTNAVTTSIDGLLPGNYTVTVTDSHNCTAQQSYNVGSGQTATTYYLDADHDGYYVSSVTQCSDPGANYTTVQGTLGDCDDANPAFHEPVTYYLDADQDGYDSSQVTQCSDPGAGYSTTPGLPGDCNDADGAIHPGATEICDGGVDNDCNGLADNNDDGISDQTMYFPDADGDTYGDFYAGPSFYCLGTNPGDFVESNNDCDDTPVTGTPIHPGADEVCDGGIDNDCNFVADDDDANTLVSSKLSWYADADIDGYGDVSDVVLACLNPPGEGRVSNHTDCNDADINIHPGATEICSNSIDDDCDGSTDEGCSSNVELTLHVLVQGFYDAGSHLMSTPLYTTGGYSQGPQNPDAVDSITVELHDALNAHDLIESSMGELKTNGDLQVIFTSAVQGSSYFIVVKGRNSIETWSKDPVYMDAVTTFDFIHP